MDKIESDFLYRLPKSAMYSKFNNFFPKHSVIDNFGGKHLKIHQRGPSIQPNFESIEMSLTFAARIYGKSTTYSLKYSKLSKIYSPL